MQRMWHQFFAAVAAVVAVAGMASAQNASPSPYPLQPVRAVPVPAQAAATPITAVSGCSNCGAPAAAPRIPYAQYGPRDRNGCGSAKADCGFIFGGCRPFFDPCGPQPWARSRGCSGGSCPMQPLAQPYGTKHSGCLYDSYLNH